MKTAFFLFLLTSFSAHASPLFSVKDRLRIDLWINGLDEKPVDIKSKEKVAKPLPEEIARILKKI